MSSVSSATAACTSDDIFQSHEHDNYCKSDIDICRGVQVKAEVEVDVCEAERSRAEKLRVHRLKHPHNLFLGLKIENQGEEDQKKSADLCNLFSVSEN